MRIAIAARRAAGFLTLALMMGATAASAATDVTPSWNGWRWSRTGVLAIKTVNRLTADWQPWFQPALDGWSAASQIDLIATAGTPSSTCSAVYGTIQVCNGNYGANGWLGYAYAWTSNSRIVQATVKLNDYYFAQTKYNTDAWRMQTICQEIGHTIGLNHNDTNRSNANTGSCMDYTSNPLGGGALGPLQDIAAGAMDFRGLDVIYANLDTNQLTQTRPTMLVGDGYSIDDEHHDIEIPLSAVPEPQSWAMLIAGFGLIGFAQRRRPRSVAA